MKETLKQSEELLNVSTPHHPLTMSVKRFADFHILKKKKSLSCTYTLCHTERLHVGVLFTAFPSFPAQLIPALLYFHSFTPLLSFPCCLGDPSAAFETGGFC